MEDVYDPIGRAVEIADLLDRLVARLGALARKTSWSAMHSGVRAAHEEALALRTYLGWAL